MGSRPIRRRMYTAAHNKIVAKYKKASPSVAKTRLTPSQRLKQRIIDELKFDISESAQLHPINYHDSRNLDRVVRWGMRDGNRYFWSYSTVTEMLKEKKLGFFQNIYGEIQII